MTDAPITQEQIAALRAAVARTEMGKAPGSRMNVHSEDIRALFLAAPALLAAAEQAASERARAEEARAANEANCEQLTGYWKSTCADLASERAARESAERERDELQSRFNALEDAAENVVIAQHSGFDLAPQIANLAAACDMGAVEYVGPKPVEDLISVLTSRAESAERERDAMREALGKMVDRLNAITRAAADAK